MSLLRVKRSYCTSIIAFGHAVLLASILSLSPANAQTPSAGSPELTLERIFSSREFVPKRLGGFRWLKGDTYAALEPSEKVKGARDLVRYNIETQKRDILIPAEKLIPQGSSSPLSIEGYEWTADDRKVLIYTNSQKVWRL